MIFFYSIWRHDFSSNPLPNAKGFKIHSFSLQNTIFSLFTPFTTMVALTYGSIKVRPNCWRKVGKLYEKVNRHISFIRSDNARHLCNESSNGREDLQCRASIQAGPSQDSKAEGGSTGKRGDFLQSEKPLQHIH